MTALDPRSLRNAFGRFMTGVTVVSCRDEAGNPMGFTANSFTSVSLDPPLLLVCPGEFLSSYEAFVSCDHFGVSILAEGQEDVANIFAGFKGDRFGRVSHRNDLHGVPLVDEAIAQFSCKTHQVIPAGDHCILMGEVMAFEQKKIGGLGYTGGQFFSLGLERQERNPAAKKNICGALVEADGKVLLEPTPNGYRLPECNVPDHGSLRSCLQNALADRGVTSELGPVFSVFDEPETRTHFAYLLARASSVNLDCRLEAVPAEELAELSYASSALARMMERFSLEARTRNFSLYLGDALAGATHQLHERA
jgi:flavin-dependent trigonelline monooxygenase, reductase component